MNKLKLLTLVLCFGLALLGNALSAKSFVDGTEGPLPTGNSDEITVVSTSDNGEAMASSFACTINQPIVITANGSTNLCAGQHVNLNAGNWSHYHWNTGSNNQSINAYFNGNYCVTVTDADGCTGTACIHVTVHARPFPRIRLSGPFSLCAGQQTLNAGTGYSSYHWNTGATTQTINPMTTGLYSCTVTNVWGCTGVGYRFAFVIQGPSVSITTTGSIGCNSGSATLTASNNTNYHWSTGESTQSITVTAAGTYCVSVNGFLGCSATACTTLTGSNNISCSITPDGPTSFCAGGSVNLDAGAGFASYTWSDGSNGQVLTATATGTYCCTVTDANGCSCVACIDVTSYTSPNPAITLSSPPTFCNGGNVVLDAGAWATYSWNSGETTESILIYSGGQFCVTVTDGVSGCIGSSCLDVVANPVPTPVVTASGATTFCDGGNVILDAGAGYDSYTWSDGSNGQSFTATTSGTYCVTVSLPDGCTGSACMDVTVNANPTPSISGTTSICDGSSTTLDAGTWDAYSWSTNDMTNAITTYTAGNYCVTVTDANGCVGSTCVDVIVNSNPTASIVGATTACSGSCVTLDAGSWTSYSWSDASNGQTTTVCATGTNCVTVTDANGCVGSACVDVTIYDNPTVTAGDVSGCAGSDITLMGSPAGGSWSVANPYNGPSTSYTYSYTDNNGCSGQATSNITVNANPTVTAGDVSGCAGSNITLMGSPAGGSWNQANPYSGPSTSYTYSYTDGNGCSGNATSNITVNTNPTPSISGPVSACNGSITLSTGNFASYNWSNGGNGASSTFTSSTTACVTVTDGNGCSGVACQNISVNTAPTCSITGPTSVCSGVNASATLTANGGTSYSWSNGATTQSITVNAGGTYHCTVSNASGCTCVASHTVTVTTFNNPTITGTTFTCAGGFVTISTGSYASYLWSTGETTQAINVSTSGMYSVTVTQGNCVGSASRSVTIGISPIPVITANGPTTFCQGGSVVLDGFAGGAATYVWSNGSTNQSSGPITTGGTYCVTATNVLGCTGSACRTITVNNFITPNITGTIPTSCSATSMVLNAGAGYASYNWASGETTQFLTITGAGSYTVSVTNTNGCNGNATFNASNFCPKAVASIAGPASGCGSLTLTASGGVSYLWSNGATTAANTVSTTGAYTVTVTNACGCTGTASRSASILVAANSNITATGLLTYCAGTGNATLTAASNAAYLWSTGAVTQAIVITPNHPGNYCVTVTNTAGCTGVACTVLSSDCIAPTPATIPTINITSNSAYAQWVQPGCVNGYNVQIRKQGTLPWTTYVIAPNSHYTFSGLTHNTCYEYQIQTRCDATGTNVSAFTAIQTFCTTARIAGSEVENSFSSFNIYPNPATDHVMVTFNTLDEANYTVSMVDVTGRTIMNEVRTSVMGDNQVEINTASIAKGVYFVIFTKGDQKVQSKLIVQ